MFDTIYRDRGGCRSLNLYAGWKEFPGFKSNDLGHIVGCTGSIEAVFDGFLCIPGYENCVGIEKGAFDGMEEDVFELYIPANITYIEEGAFDNLTNLMFIEASGTIQCFTVKREFCIIMTGRWRLIQKG